MPSLELRALAPTAHDAITRVVQGMRERHPLLRIESSGHDRVGLISTTDVWPAHRRTGLATRLLACAEAWFIEQQLPRSCTWTSSTNVPLIALYAAHGYRQTDQGPNDLTDTLMIQLSRDLPPTDPQKP